MKIKIAIPTDDKINISENFDTSDFFKLITIENREIASEKFIRNSAIESQKDSTNYIKQIIILLNDCDYIILKNISADVKKYLEEQNKNIVETSEKIITNAELNFLTELIRNESNTCCCP